MSPKFKWKYEITSRLYSFFPLLYSSSLKLVKATIYCWQKQLLFSSQVTKPSDLMLLLCLLCLDQGLTLHSKSPLHKQSPWDPFPFSAFQIVSELSCHHSGRGWSLFHLSQECVHVQKKSTVLPVFFKMFFFVLFFQSLSSLSVLGASDWFALCTEPSVFKYVQFKFILFIQCQTTTTVASRRFILYFKSYKNRWRKTPH